MDIPIDIPLLCGGVVHLPVSAHTNNKARVSGFKFKFQISSLPWRDIAGT